jgi:hypothetical protein
MLNIKHSITRHSTLFALYDVLIVFTAAVLTTTPKARNFLESPKNNDLSVT